jgi:hypothetical protein
MNTQTPKPRRPKATQIRFEGPDVDVDRISGDEIPQWYVYAADADSEPAGKVYTVRKSFAFAAALAARMADDRRLPLEIEAQPA